MRAAGEQVRMLKEALTKMDASQREVKSQLEAERSRHLDARMPPPPLLPPFSRARAPCLPPL